MVYMSVTSVTGSYIYFAIFYEVYDEVVAIPHSYVTSIGHAFVFLQERGQNVLLCTMA